MARGGSMAGEARGHTQREAAALLLQRLCARHLARATAAKLREEERRYAREFTVEDTRWVAVSSLTAATDGGLERAAEIKGHAGWSSRSTSFSRGRGRRIRIKGPSAMVEGDGASWDAATAPGKESVAERPVRYVRPGSGTRHYRLLTGRASEAAMSDRN